MKSKIQFFGLLALAAGLFTATANAQTNDAPNTNLLSVATGKTLVDAVKGSGILSATNYAVEPYATYMPSAPKGTQWGGGILAIYNVNQYVGAGLGVDYLGQFSIVSGDCTLKYPIHLGQYAGKIFSGLSNFTVTPFALAGIGKPLTGSSSGISVIADAGFYTQFGHWLGGDFNTGFCYGKWINAGDYSGARYHIFAGWSKGF